MPSTVLLTIGDNETGVCVYVCEWVLSVMNEVLEVRRLCI
jgi:hypothetical protein